MNMPKLGNSLFVLPTALLLALAEPQSADAQEYPAREITIVSSFSPGTPTDLLARLLAEGVQKELGVPVTVEPKPGAFGSLAAGTVARSAPDGYSLVMITNGTHAANPYIYKSIPYDPVKDFTILSAFAIGQNILVSGPSVTAKTVGELVELEKAAPGSLKYGTSTATSLAASELFNMKTDIKMKGISYTSGAQIVTDLLAGQIQVAFLDQLTASPLVSSGQLKGFAVTGKTRSALVPELPTMQEAGLAGYQVNSWIGVAAPAGIDPAIIQRLGGALQKVEATPAFTDALAKLGYEHNETTPKSASQYVVEQNDFWKNLASSAGIELR